MSDKPPTRQKCANCAALRERAREAEKQVAFYACEGRTRDPAIIEWRALADKKCRTKTEQKRLNEICRFFRDEDMDALERLEEIRSLRRQIKHLGRSAKAMLSVARYFRATYFQDALTPRDNEIKAWEQDVERAGKVILSKDYNAAGAPPLIPTPDSASSKTSLREEKTQSLEETDA